MRMTRLFVNQPLGTGHLITLPPESTHYLLTVLRLKESAKLTIFNGQGGEYTAQFITLSKKIAQLQLLEYHPIERESSLSITLVQALARTEHFDYAIQKAVELGITQFVPVFTERSPSFAETQLDKKQQHWQKIIHSACEQCGRNQLPQLLVPQSLETWLTHPLTTNLGLVLSPTGQPHWPRNLPKSNTAVTLLIGPEGGLSSQEIEQAQHKGYQHLAIGNRILRTETATVVALTTCQVLWGNLAPTCSHPSTSKFHNENSP